MAKRKTTQPTPEQKYETKKKRRAILIRIMQGAILIIAILYGSSQAYPIIATGQLWQGILVGLAYGVGSLLVISGAFFLNQKMKGL